MKVSWYCHRWALVAVATLAIGVRQVRAVEAEAETEPDSSAAECEAEDAENECFNFFDDAKNWSPKFDLQNTINSFAFSAYGNESGFPPTERSREGISFVPGLEVRIAKKLGCAFAGAVTLSEAENCNVDAEKSPHVEQMESSNSNDFRFLVSLPEARMDLFTGPESSKFVDMVVEKVNLRLFFCVKAGPAEEFKPMHLVWYFQDANPEDPTSIWEAPDAKLHPELQLSNPHVWRDEERYRMVPIKLEGISSNLPHYSYTLMHFQARAPGDDYVARKAGNGALPCRPASFVSVVVLMVTFTMLFL